MVARYLVAVMFFGILISTVTATVLGGEGTLTFTLERAFPTNHLVDMGELRERDRVRHNRMFPSSGGVDFPLQGTYDPFLSGLYFTTIQLGSPPKKFYVLIDTGSDLFWVNCAFCDSCPSWSGLQIPLSYFDPMNSSTASVILCSDPRCAHGCSSTNNKCNYTYNYMDSSMTSGYFVEDFIHFDTIMKNSMTTTTSSPVFFGCSTSQAGNTLTNPKIAVDGIFGLGQHHMSLISQLLSNGLSPNVFSHCLKASGGGILVVGQILESNIVYTPIVPSEIHYNVNLQSISVNGQPLPISSQVFATSKTRGTFIDSGTSLAFLADEAYDPFVNAITRFVSSSPRPLVLLGSQCYVTNSSVLDIFPTVTLNFAGGASMILNPEDYLLAQKYIDGAEVMWCIGFHKSQMLDTKNTVLGDLVLKDKIIVYDVGNQQIGWKNYDCSKPIKASTNAAKKSNLSRCKQFYDFLVTCACVWLLLSF